MSQLYSASIVRAPRKFLLLSIVAALAISLLPHAASAQFVQQGAKLTATSTTAASLQGRAVALSADGNTAIVGAPSENGGLGAAWIYVRSGTTWTQQAKLLGQGASGTSVAIAADGNTVVLGEPQNNMAGAARVFTRSGTTWTQKTILIGTGIDGNADQGIAVAISGDGKTIIVGGYLDASGVGAFWTFNLISTTWIQQNTKTVAFSAVGNASQGRSVALSFNGNTAIIGGYGDNTNIGAAWVFNRFGSGGSASWSSPVKLVGTGYSGAGLQGQSVSISADGNTVAIGAPLDSGNVGATWVFARVSSGGAWSQQGAKLVGTGYVGTPLQYQTALSADGDTLLVGGTNDNSSAGATWVFKRSAGVWTQQGAKLVATGAAGTARQGASVALSADSTTALIGGSGDSSSHGAVWPFAQPVLVVSPTSNIATSGNVGGPFLPPAFEYTLKAVNADINYTISGTPAWLTVSADSGTIPAGSTATINFSVNGAANALAVGTYGSTTITITNGSSAFGSLSITATLAVGAVGPVSIVSAVLPASRSVVVGTAATAFATVINTSSNAATNCSLGLGSNIPASFRFQTTDSISNAVTGTGNAPANIPPNGVQSFVFAITPNAAFNPTDVAITAGCSNGAAAKSVVGLNTLLLSASTTPVADLVALAATASNDGIVNIPGSSGTGAFAVATVNVGVASAIAVTVDTGTAVLPVDLSLCQTNPANGQCTTPIGPAVVTIVNANDTPTFAIFAKGAANVPFDPGNNRVFVRFKDGAGVTRGATSVAVRTQ